MAIYPEVKPLVSGYFEPDDPSRCSVCGRDLASSPKADGLTCGRKCFRRQCEIQRRFTTADVDRWIEARGKELAMDPIEEQDRDRQMRKFSPRVD